MVLDLLLLIVLAVIGIFARVFFRRPWSVEAASERQRIRWSLVGLRASRQLVSEVVDGIKIGRPPETNQPTAIVADGRPPR